MGRRITRLVRSVSHKSIIMSFIPITAHSAMQAPLDQTLASQQKAEASSTPNSASSTAQAELERARDEAKSNSENDGKHNEVENPVKYNENDATGAHASTITVTGSHIKGVNTSVGSQIISLDRQDFEQAGYSTVRDIAQNLPQNFNGGATGSLQQNQDSANNVGYGSGFNLRGLGNVATLILINGRRVPMSGLTSSTSDISQIPLTAIERVEILPDGASAVYGSDAVAGVVNFILRSDFDGAETTARYGTATKGSPDEYQFSQAVGRAWQGGNFFFNYEYYKRDNLPRTERNFTKSLDLRPYGGLDHRTFYTNPGAILDPMTFGILYGLPPGQDGRSLSVDDLLPPDQVTLSDEQPKFQDLFPQQSRHSVFSNVNQNISEQIRIYLEGRFARRKTFNRNREIGTVLSVTEKNPFYFDLDGTGAPIYVAYSLSEELGGVTDESNIRDYGAVVGANVKHGNNWETELYASFAQQKIKNEEYNVLDEAILEEYLGNENSQEAFNPFGSGNSNSEDILKSITTNRGWKINAKTRQFNLVTTGVLFPFYDDDVRIAAGGDYREEKFRRVPINTRTTTSDLKRDVGALFAELAVPIVNDGNQFLGIYNVTLSFSLRHEQYDDSAEQPIEVDSNKKKTTNPRIGINVATSEQLNFRASYGTSFRAPNLTTIGSSPSAFATPIPDRLSNTGFTYVLVLDGADPDLTHETADTWTVGADITPASSILPRMRVSYFNIDFKNQINRISFSDLSDPALLSKVLRRPTLSDLQAACDWGRRGRLDASVADCTTVGLVNAVVDLRVSNVSRTKISGIDFNLYHSIKTDSIGDFYFDLNSSYIFFLKKQISRGASYISNLNRPHNPVDLRIRSSLSWSPTKQFNSSLFLNYTDKYKDPPTNQIIDSHVTFDLTMQYGINSDTTNSWLRNTSIQLSITNLFDNDPPFYDSGGVYSLGFDPENSDPIGRFIAITISKKW